MDREPTRPPEEVDDARLAAALRAGDPAALETVVRVYGPRLLRLARSLLRDEEDARDAVQEAFVSAFRHAREFRGESRVLTWLRRIVTNAALMRRRARLRRPERPIEELLPEFVGLGAFGRPEPPWQDPTRAAEVAETRALVRAAIEELPEAYRTVVTLRDIEGLDTAETAAVLDATPNAVKVRLHRARQALRALLAPRFQEVPS